MDPSQSRIPRIGNSNSSSRIPVPGSIRPPSSQFQSRLVRPSKPPTTAAAAPGFTGIATPFATPAAHSFLRPPRSAALTIARSYSGDKLCSGEPSPFPVLAASTPAASHFKPPSALNLYKKLELESTENLHEIQQPLDNTFAVEPAPKVLDIDFNDGDRMLVDESMDLVAGAGSTDNLIESESQQQQQQPMMKPASSNETVTLSANGNVTYEVKRSDTFVKEESLKLGGSRESLNRTRGASLFLNDKSGDDSPVLDRTHVVLDSVGMLEDGAKKALCSTMVVYDRLASVTQSIPNLTQELEGYGGSPDRLQIVRPSRLTFNLNETTTNLMHFSDPSMLLNKTQVFSSTMHSPSRVIGSKENILNVTKDINDLLLDSSAGERTLVAEDLNDESLYEENEPKKEIFDLSLEEPVVLEREEVIIRPVDGRSGSGSKYRYSFGLDLTDATLDCSIDLCDSSISSAVVKSNNLKSPIYSGLTKQGSFEMDESLGILTPDQMKEFLDSTTTNTNNTNNLELQLNTGSHKHALHHCRIDQTPSPEELPLDPVGVKTDMSDICLPSEMISNGGSILYQEISQTDSDSKTDQMTKSGTSKVSNSFITSITSITSLDTGYQGDGEMSRPASRGADQSPSNGPRIKNPEAQGVWPNAQGAAEAPVPRRPDPMTDSDFFTESDADDVMNRGDRRAQIIDGHLYGPMLQGANVFINQQPQNDDSCMESSGIFTDVENRGDDELIHRISEREDMMEHDEEEGIDRQPAGESDMSPDLSTDTISSANTACSQKKVEPIPETGEGVNCSQNASARSSVISNVSVRPFSVEHDCQVSRREDDVNKHAVTPSPQALQSPSSSLASPSVLNQSASFVVAVSADKAESASNASDVSTASKLSEDGREVCVLSPNASNDSLSGAVVGSASSSGSSRRSSGKKPPGGGTFTGSSSSSNSRKQQKNETNLVLKKHDMSSRAALIKTRLFKDSSVGSGSRSSSLVVEGSALGSLDAGPECENQENKRPSSASIRGGGSVGNLSFIKKSATPNKWDAVMSKIAENKAVIKKNFSDVKSKISCGKSAISLVRRVDSPASLKSPPSECNSSIGSRSVSGVAVTGSGKRTVSGSVKRGRTHSKDSQQSSQSDLSLSGGSPKLAPKVSSTRPAKKRDVRTINSSSSGDLGPPPSKTTLGAGSHINNNNNNNNGINGQHHRSSLRTAATMQKRVPSSTTTATPGSNSATPIPIVPEQLKGSPPPLKRNLIAKRTVGSAIGTPHGTVKTPLKDHNRLVGPTPTSKQQSTANSPKSKTLIRSHPPSTTTTTTTATPLSRNQHHHNHHSDHPVNYNGSSGGAAATGATNGTKTSPASATTTTPKNGSGTMNGMIQRNGTIILEKSPPLNGRHEGLDDAGGLRAAGPQEAALKIMRLANGTEQLTDAKNLVDISLLNHANRGVEALGVLVQYLVYNLDAFSCPTIKQSHQKATHDLLETKSLLDEERTTCQSLRQQLLETTEREAELQELHRCEISKAESCLTEQQRSAAERIAALEQELHRREMAAETKLRTCADQFETKLAAKEAELENSKAREQELLQRISDLSCTENELREKVHSSELEFSERLLAAAMRERDLTEQLNQFNRQLEEFRRSSQAREQELLEKLNLVQDECNYLRHNRSATEQPSQDDLSMTGSDNTLVAGPLQNTRSSSSLNHAQALQDEVDSLRCVLDLKQREISELRKQVQEYERDAKELPGALVKISALESRIEDLQVQLKTKTEEEKDLQQKLKQLNDNLKQETKVKSRLSQHNEELQWKLKQNSEKFSHVCAELSKSYHENSTSYMSTTRASLDQTATGLYGYGQNHTNTIHSRSSGSERVFEMDDLSPPTSPIIKGVVEKSDSVSWVLEMDDEPPEISASRIVRRAGSFRSTFGQELKRQKCLNNSTNNGATGLQQSSSVGSILKQQSHEASPSKMMASPGTPRLRSKSVSIKTTEPPKKIVRSNSGASTSVTKPIRMAEVPLSWKEPPLYSSSPYAHKRYLNDRSAVGSQREGKDLFLEESEFLSDAGGTESPYSPRSRAGSFGAAAPIVDRLNATHSQIEFFHRDKTPNFKKSKENRGLITCDTTALTSGNTNDPVTPAHKKRREFARKNLTDTKNDSLPKEAAGEALVSGSNSDDDEDRSSSSCLSDDISSGGSSSSSSSSSSTSTGSGVCGSDSGSGADEVRQALLDGAERSQQSRRRSSNVSIEDALMHRIVASLNGGLSAHGGPETPMEVSWSEDGDPSESVV
ncbi:serine-rich adhesin for platelets-like isoform X2 [Uranotaenia lowii]|uniref:serine-rich adhesin for platelets-like isoform X2 n=1 Tax=Uranotaenia lowii TaxID=190385 RepID=UPI002478672B|nr:serine-rich adhesin for platelets-like isoform X2 [Uranotaenia lowii]